MIRNQSTPPPLPLDAFIMLPRRRSIVSIFEPQNRCVSRRLCRHRGHHIPSVWDLRCDHHIDAKCLPTFGCILHFCVFSPGASMRALEGNMHKAKGLLHVSGDAGVKEIHRSFNHSVIFLAFLLGSSASFRSSRQASDPKRISCIALSRSFVPQRVLYFCPAPSALSALHFPGVWCCPHSGTHSLSPLSSELPASSCHLFPRHLSFLQPLSAPTVCRGSWLCGYK